ncbi:DUF3224 domain-containing protein [Streptomyces sp. ISL-43]|uniref:DUF3224 domain-containing protein n=1 Tax=Streptomyces sp. ISL-43 TaxID=2819183 RepID=UPI001BE613D5|nr:DUF3224 domain-containing protein [Streptomyces sp. ISL-43]MBT2449537.1 DUF3224 domain-containing protein [Streptomyces sp. ISL-43]
MSTPAPTSAATEASGGFTFENWEEHPVGPTEAPFPRLARATVTNAFTGVVTAPETSCSYAIVYTGESTGTFTGMELVTGTVGGRKGSFVLEERGTFDATGTRCGFEVVPGSATAELAGLTGSGSFVYRHGDTSVEYAFSYDLP